MLCGDADNMARVDVNEALIDIISQPARRFGVT